MKALLEGLLPRILPGDMPAPTVIAHEGKADLDRSIPRKLRAWQDPSARFVVLRDQDSADCLVLKQKLAGICTESRHGPVLIRIACREVESWYLADLAAIDGAFATKLRSRQGEKKFRDPDHLGTPSGEVKKLVPSFGKISGARRMGPHLKLDNGRSPSFFNFVRGVRALVAASDQGAK